MSYDRDAEREQMRRSRRRSPRAEQPRRNRGRGRLVLGGIGLLAIIGVTNFAGLAPSSPDRDCTVAEKSVGMQSKKMQQRVYTDCGVFVVQDELFLGHFSSADTYGSLTVGAAYELETVGPRIPFLSMFPNIIGVTPAPAATRID